MAERAVVRSLAIEGTLFWIIATEITLLYTGINLYYSPLFQEYFLAVVLVVGLEILLGYECWRGVERAFLATFIFTAVNSVLSFFLQGPLYTFGVLVIVCHLMTAFFSSRAWRELRTKQPP